jgi:uncharacterized membrane protein YhaH (DUF805 family)
MNIDFVSLLTTWQGRVNRAKYWIAIVIYIVLFGIMWKLILGGWAPGLDEEDMPSTLPLIIGGVIYILVAISGTMVAIKRLHDRNKSGWWVLLFIFGPMVLSMLGGVIPGIGFVFSLGGLAISIWAIVELGFLKGTAGANQYGPDPITG